MSEMDARDLAKGMTVAVVLGDERTMYVIDEVDVDKETGTVGLTVHREGEDPDDLPVFITRWGSDEDDA